MLEVCGDNDVVFTGQVATLNLTSVQNFLQLAVVEWKLRRDSARSSSANVIYSLIHKLLYSSLYLSLTCNEFSHTETCIHTYNFHQKLLIYKPDTYNSLRKLITMGTFEGDNSITIVNIRRNGKYGAIFLYVSCQYFVSDTL